MNYRCSYKQLACNLKVFWTQRVLLEWGDGARGEYVIIHTKCPPSLYCHSVDRADWQAKMASIEFWTAWQIRTSPSHTHRGGLYFTLQRTTSRSWCFSSSRTWSRFWRRCRIPSQSSEVPLRWDNHAPFFINILGDLHIVTPLALSQFWIVCEREFVWERLREREGERGGGESAERKKERGEQENEREREKERARKFQWRNWQSLRWCGNYPKIWVFSTGFICVNAVESPGIGKRQRYFVRFRRSTCCFWRSTIQASWVRFFLAITWWSRDEANPDQMFGQSAFVGRTVPRFCEKSNFSFAGIHHQGAWSRVYLEKSCPEALVLKQTLSGPRAPSPRDVSDPVQRATRTMSVRRWWVRRPLTLRLQLSAHKASNMKTNS